MSARQKIGQALEELAYDGLKDLLKSRLGTAGREFNVSNGLLWRTSNYSLFYNRQTVKHGTYAKGVTFKRKRIADLVLCDNSRKASQVGGFYKNAILAIELKNTNLDYKWSAAWVFDRDVLSRFIWTQDVFDTLNANGRGWEAQAGLSNLFPNAIKVLIIPRFTYLPSATKVPVKLDYMTKRFLANYITQGLIPASSSEKDQIQWRIKRLKLQIHELNWQVRPSDPTPYWVNRNFRAILSQYLTQLGI